MRKACKVTALALMVCMPPLVWWLGIASPWIAALLLAAGVLHFAGADSGFGRLQGALAVAVGVVIGAGSHRMALYYPVIVNAAFLLLWFHTGSFRRASSSAWCAGARASTPRSRCTFVA
ncbi:MAG: hypothetical protein M5U09_23360 [Gammaproteobacteria bacterium]|nr:hypothetical protein [Gammaproteobacteria bacterium]